MLNLYVLIITSVLLVIRRDSTNHSRKPWCRLTSQQLCLYQSTKQEPQLSKLTNQQTLKTHLDQTQKFVHLSKFTVFWIEALRTNLNLAGVDNYPVLKGDRALKVSFRLIGRRKHDRIVFHNYHLSQAGNDLTKGKMDIIDHFWDRSVASHATSI